MFITLRMGVLLYIPFHVCQSHTDLHASTSVIRRCKIITRCDFCRCNSNNNLLNISVTRCVHLLSYFLKILIRLFWCTFEIHTKSVTQKWSSSVDNCKINKKYNLYSFHSGWTGETYLLCKRAVFVAGTIFHPRHVYFNHEMVWSSHGAQSELNRPVAVSPESKTDNQQTRCYPSVISTWPPEPPSWEHFHLLFVDILKFSRHYPPVR